MTKIENDTQYRWALQRVEELLPHVKDDTPLTDPYSMELELLSGLALCHWRALVGGYAQVADV